MSFQRHISFSFKVVENMRNGMSPTDAAKDALKRIIKYVPAFEGALVAASKDGKYGKQTAIITLFAAFSAEHRIQTACIWFPGLSYCISISSLRHWISSLVFFFLIPSTTK